VASSPSFKVPAKNSTFVTVPSVSPAVAPNATVAGAIHPPVPAGGTVSVTVGG
jgi:hypothetical protein